MQIWQIIVVIVVGIVAGFFNTLAGGGSLLSVPALIFVGLPATVAKNPKRFSRAVFDWRGRSVGYLAEDRVFDSLQGSFR